MNQLYSLFFLIILTACQSSPSTPQHKTTLFTANVMTIDYRILIGDEVTAEKKKKIEKIINTTFAEINDIYNKWNPNSELSKLNRLKASVASPISPELEQFLYQTQKIVEISDGLFDPTIEPMQQLWKEKLAAGQTPSEPELEAIVPAIGWNRIHFGNGSFYKDHDLTSLDLGGIAKGYCVDLLVERLNGAGFPNVFVEWGGEIRTSGEHPDHRPWTIFISRLGDPDPEHAIAKLSLINQAIATSGDYLQQWSISADLSKKPVTYFHIFDPRTHRPLQATDTSVASASVVAPTCMLADGLATVAMMFPTITEAQAWAEKVKAQHPEIEFWLVTREKIALSAE